MSRRFLVLCVALLGSFCRFANAQTSDVRDIPTRSGATARFLWIEMVQFQTSGIPVVGSAVWIRKNLAR